MATTMFFEGPIRDQENDDQIALEFGRSSFHGGLSRMYFSVDGKTVILSEADGAALYEAMQSLAIYLGYEQRTTIVPAAVPPVRRVSPTPPLKVGDRVSHAKFGPGTVVGPITAMVGPDMNAPGGVRDAGWSIGVDWDDKERSQSRIGDGALTVLPADAKTNEGLADV